ncbi:MAG: hypothetical protein JXR10_13175 [Cyclobacteriaceae bacterium]
MIKEKNKFKEIEGAEFGVDSRYTSKKEQLDDGKALMEARLHRMKNLSSDKIIKAKLLQLKFKMEEFVKEPVYQEENHFTKFLTSYIDTIYSKRIDFAKDIDIDANLLSKIVNNHRKPKEDFLLRLMIHSEKTYNNICHFHKRTWYQVYLQEKLSALMANQDQWRPEVERHVKIQNLANLND